MSFRYIPPEPGMEAWIHGERGHGLPEGLPHMARVEIVGEVDSRDMLVEHEGVHFVVRKAVLDAGREYRTRSGRWIPESDERARRWLVKAVLATREWKDVPGLYYTGLEARNRVLRDLEWQLRRNGWEVPGEG